MPTNALLVRWHGGWAERTSIGGGEIRREALLGIGAVQSSEEMARVADSQLAIFRDERVQILADLQPADDGDTPYLAFKVGDTLTIPDEAGAPVSERVVSITVTEDEEGNVQFAPEFHDVILSQQERFAQVVKQMSNGTLAGNSRPATPASQISTAAPNCCPPQPHVGTT